MARQQNGRPLSRRQFLKRTAAAAAGTAAFPTIIPGRALGLDGATAPSNRLTLGFIGMGKMAKGHLDAYLSDASCQILAICDVEQGRRERAAVKTNASYAKSAGENSYSACDTYGDFRVLCARADIDFVVIATPNHWHALTALEALRNGKDVYLEKPMTRTVEEGRILIDRRAPPRAHPSGGQPAAVGQHVSVCLRTGAQRPHRRGAGRLREHQRPARGGQPSRRTDARGARLGHVARPVPVAALLACAGAAGVV